MGSASPVRRGAPVFVLGQPDLRRSRAPESRRLRPSRGCRWRRCRRCRCGPAFRSFSLPPTASGSALRVDDVADRLGRRGDVAVDDRRSPLGAEARRRAARCGSVHSRCTRRIGVEQRVGHRGAAGVDDEHAVAAHRDRRCCCRRPSARRGCRGSAAPRSGPRGGAWIIGAVASGDGSVLRARLRAHKQAVEGGPRPPCAARITSARAAARSRRRRCGRRRVGREAAHRPRDLRADLRIHVRGAAH